MYQILVADDEIWIRKAIVKRIVSLGLEVEVAGEAADGEEALAMALKKQPDIIITDIKMPRLNGLEFIKKIRECQPAAKIIIISGYADFEYARTALQLGVSQYILKTVDDEDLHDTLQKVICQIEQERHVREDWQSLHAQLAERTLILQKNFIYQLLSGKVTNENYIRRMIVNLDLQLEEGTFYCVMVVQLLKWPSLEALNDLFGKLRRFFMERKYNCYLCEDQQGFNMVNILLYSANRQDIAKTSVCRLAQELSGSYSHCFSYIGISKVCSAVTQIKAAYIQAADALSNQELLKNKEDKYLHFEEVDINERVNDYFTIDLQRNLIYNIESGNQNEITQQIISILNKMNNNRQISTKTLLKFYYEVILLLEKLLNKHGTSAEQALGSDLVTLVNKYQTSQPEHLERLLISLACKAAEGIASSRQRDSQSLIAAIQKYLENHYFEDISLDTIAHKFFISKIYFSQQFKKETGVTFIAYLTRIRMEEASQLLRTSRLKVQEVARIVGYSDPLYFGQVFKKYFGILPSEYVTD
jgi:two-component system response regulator YesN